nr:hypothetical protein [Arthrobacter sp. TS-15]
MRFDTVQPGCSEWRRRAIRENHREHDHGKYPCQFVAADYDQARSDVKEYQERSLEDLQSANAPDARSVVTELDEATPSMRD